MVNLIKSYFLWRRAYSIKKWLRECIDMDEVAYYNGEVVRRSLQ